MRGWAAGGTLFGHRRHLGRGGGLDLRKVPVTILGQFFQRAAALVPPEGSGAGWQGGSCHGIVMNTKKFPRRNYGEELPAIPRTPPQAPRWPMPSVQPLPRRPHPGRVVVRDVYVHAPRPADPADVGQDEPSGHGPFAVRSTCPVGAANRAAPNSCVHLRSNRWPKNALSK